MLKILYTIVRAHSYMEALWWTSARRSLKSSRLQYLYASVSAGLLSFYSLSVLDVHTDVMNHVYAFRHHHEESNEAK